MKIVYIGNKISFKLKRQIKKAILITLNNLKQNSKGLQVNINFINGEEMRELNNRTRNIDKITDVLSYPNLEVAPFSTIDINNQPNDEGRYILLGDMAVCLEKAGEQADEYGHSLEDEVIKLVIHSTLHLMGFDHIKDEDYEIMKKEEEKIASKFYTNKQIL